MPIQHLTAGIRYERPEQERIYSEAEPEFEEPADYNEVLLKILHSPNIASREHVYRYYDTEVMGNAVIRPGEADAGLIAPVRGEKFGVALSCGLQSLLRQNQSLLGRSYSRGRGHEKCGRHRRHAINSNRLPELRQP